MTPLLSLVLDVAIAGLLISVIIYCRKLNGSIKVLQDSRSEMAKLFSEFDQSIEAARNSVRELKESSRQTEDLLKEKLDTANSIADDLAFMIERGNKMADQLETGIKGGRGGASATAKADTAPKTTAEPKMPPFGGNAGKSAEKSTKETGGNSSRTASIESVLEQMANRNNPGKSGDGKPHSRIRSKAEQELFDSLKSNR